MGVSEWTLVGTFAFTVIFGVIGWLLTNKDQKQQQDINTLFERQRQMELNMANNYHKKTEIRELVEDLKVYLNERFDHMERIWTNGKGQ